MVHEIIYLFIFSPRNFEKSCCLGLHAQNGRRTNQWHRITDTELAVRQYLKWGAREFLCTVASVYHIQLSKGGRRSIPMRMHGKYT